MNKKNKIIMIGIFFVFLMLSINTINAAYLNNITVDKKSLVYGQEDIITIKLTHNNTPVTNGSISVTAYQNGSYYNDYLYSGKTDNNGEIKFNMSQLGYGSHQLFISNYNLTHTDAYLSTYLQIRDTNSSPIDITTSKITILDYNAYNITIKAEQTNNPLSNREIIISTSDFPNYYSGAYLKGISNNEGIVIFNLSKFSNDQFIMYYGLVDDNENYLKNSSLIKIPSIKIKAIISNLKYLANHKTQINIQLLDQYNNTLSGAYHLYLNKLKNGKLYNEITNTEWYETARYLDYYNNYLGDYGQIDIKKGVNTVILKGWIYKGIITLEDFGGYNIYGNLTVDNKRPLNIKVMGNYLNSKYYFIEYAVYDSGKKVYNELKALVNGKTYFGENGHVLIPINGFKTYNVKLYYNGDSVFSKSEINTSYTLTGNEIIKQSMTGKLIKKFKRFGHTYGKYKIYNVYQKLNGKIFKEFSHYETSLYSAEKYKLFKTANEKIKINGFIPSIYLKNKLRIKAYYDGNNDIKLNYYFQYKKGGISKLAGYIKIHKYKTYYSWYNKQFLLSFSSNLNKKLAIKYARIIGW